jgi:asparagine synthase (glutamine-hydrolysing)
VSGIYGIVGGPELPDASLMAARLTHRGCITGEVVRPQVRAGCIGARASVASSADGRWIAVADASIYNVEALVSGLPRGALDGPPSAASLMLALHAAHGRDGIEKIDGEFAAVLVHVDSLSVVLCRDYFGCRPLHYAPLGGGGVAFASEYKALLALSRVSAEPDRDMVQYVQNAKRLPLGRTLLKHVHAAPPGTVLTLDRRANEKERLTFEPLRSDVTVYSEAEVAELVLARLRDAVVRRTRDVERVGLALSGGIDSIGMASLIREVLPGKPLFTFTAGSDEDDPEIKTAGEAAKLLGSTHEVVLTPPSLLRDSLPELTWHLEDPLARTEALQLWKIGRAAAGKVDVLLSGQGADGVFGGMPRHMLLALMKRLPPLRKGLREFYTYTQLGLPPQAVIGRLLAWAKFRGNLPPVPRVTGAALPEAWTFPPVGREFINRVMAAGFQAGVCQDIPKFERTFAASGLDYRPPYYDLGFVRSGFTITDDLKIRGSKQKYILRRSLDGLVPPRFRELKKFPQRMNVDAAFSDAMVDIVTRTLTPERITSRGFFAVEDIRRLSAARRNGRFLPEAAARLWTVVLTEMWAQRFLDARGEAPVPAVPVLTSRLTP